MQTDEAGTLALVGADFTRMRDLCARHGGEVLNSMGDGLLLCFGSVVEAVSWALEVQAEFARRPGTALQHRIGIHLGDVFRREGQIAGDGVNIAARLQTKARPGSVCLSQSVYDAVRGKLAFQTQALGPQTFKNIAEPLTVFLVSPMGLAPVSIPARRHRAAWLAAAVAGVVLLAAGAWLGLRRTPPAPPAVVANPGPARPEKSLAVLPFTNMSDEKDNAVFADGVHEDLLTNLANLGDLRVISRTSVMQYRGTTKPLRQIAAELGVAYVLEGSVRREGNRVRVTGQLIDARTDEHVWAKAYDRDVTDVFAIQAELSRAIAEATQSVLSPQGSVRLDRRPTTSMAAYDLFQRARAISRTGSNLRDEAERALPLLESAVQLDPAYAAAWTQICLINLDLYEGEDRTEARLARARAALARAEQAAPDEVGVLLAGSTLGVTTQDRAMVSRYRDRIISLYPNRAEAQVAIALNLGYEGRWNDSLEPLRRARATDPLNPEILDQLAGDLIGLRRYDEAESVQRSLHELRPDNLDDALQLAMVPLYRGGSTAELRAFLAGLPANDDFADVNNTLVRAQALYALGDAPAVIRLWRRAGSNWKDHFGASREAALRIGEALVVTGQAAEARALLAPVKSELQAKLLVEHESVANLNDYGLVLALLGELPEARAALARSRQLLGENPRMPGAKDHRFDNACYRAWAGEKTEAIQELRQILQTGPFFTANVHELRQSLVVQPLRGDPAFEALLREPASNAPRL